jgi:DNA invertase Pin-like site-specific DNA recombinase
MTDLEIASMRAAEYVRMSTESQQYSIANQQAAIREYASEHGIRVVRTYADPGKSGLTFKNRPGLRQLLADITAGLADFTIILVYDVSRWGRFQDTDEGAYYEFLCRRANFRVEYCAEPFDNVASPLTAVYKAIKRSMAAEYSREQSARVFRGVSRIASLGHFSGGRPGYGYRRMLVSADGTHKGILETGVLRSIRSDYMVLVPGPRKEVVTVRRIFRLYVERRLTPPQIADLLNDEGKTNSIGSRWHPQEISLILRSERYVGTLIYNRRSAKLRTRETANPEQSWIRVRGAHCPCRANNIRCRTKDSARTGAQSTFSGLVAGEAASPMGPAWPPLARHRHCGRPADHSRIRAAIRRPSSRLRRDRLYAGP